jgi:hypothetical protein
MLRTAVAKHGKQYRDGRWLRRSNTCKQHDRRTGQLWSQQTAESRAAAEDDLQATRQWGKTDVAKIGKQ